MKRAFFIGVTAVLALPLAACSGGGMLNGKSGVPNASGVATNAPLSMPPDLRLPAPGTAAYAPSVASQTADRGDVYGGGAPAAPGYMTRGQQMAAATPGTRDAAFAKYGISKVKPDGTPKSKDELEAELKAAIIAEKRRTNPGYGTIRNIGSVFRDG